MLHWVMELLQGHKDNEQSTWAPFGRAVYTFFCITCVHGFLLQQAGVAWFPPGPDFMLLSSGDFSGTWSEFLENGDGDGSKHSCPS